MFVWPQVSWEKLRRRWNLQLKVMLTMEILDVARHSYRSSHILCWWRPITSPFFLKTVSPPPPQNSPTFPSSLQDDKQIPVISSLQSVYIINL